MSKFAALWRSTVDLHRRFRGPDFRPTSAGAINAFDSEVEELREAATQKHLFVVIEEGVDVIVTVLGVMLAHGAMLEDVESMMEAVCRKNDAKTWATHELNPDNDRIMRRPRKTGG
jgi:hypothetical protein